MFRRKISRTETDHRKTIDSKTVPSCTFIMCRRIFVSSADTFNTRSLYLKVLFYYFKNISMRARAYMLLLLLNKIKRTFFRRVSCAYTYDLYEFARACVVWCITIYSIKSICIWIFNFFFFICLYVRAAVSRRGIHCAETYTYSCNDGRNNITLYHYDRRPVKIIVARTRARHRINSNYF